MKHVNGSHQFSALSLTIKSGILAIALLAGIQSAQAQTPVSTTNTNLIQSCIDREGNLKIISPTTTCHREHKPLNWNKQGPAGLPGAPGLVGATGAQGAAGLPGVSGYQQVVVATANEKLPAFGETVRFANCPAGKKVIGGGGIIFNASGRWIVDTSGPSSETQWAIAFTNVTGNPITAGQMSIYAICITAN
jgi:hypothetical protein